MSTSASSEIYGHFTLAVADEETEPIPHNATAYEVGTICVSAWGDEGDAFLLLSRIRCARYEFSIQTSAG